MNVDDVFLKKLLFLISVDNNFTAENLATVSYKIKSLKSRERGELKR